MLKHPQQIHGFDAPDAVVMIMPASIRGGLGGWVCTMGVFKDASTAKPVIAPRSVDTLSLAQRYDGSGQPLDAETQERVAAALPPIVTQADPIFSYEYPKAGGPVAYVKGEDPFDTIEEHYVTNNTSSSRV